jgi:hypothetical protein
LEEVTKISLRKNWTKKVKSERNKSKKRRSSRIIKPWKAKKIEKNTNNSEITTTESRNGKNNGCPNNLNSSLSSKMRIWRTLFQKLDCKKSHSKSIILIKRRFNKKTSSLQDGWNRERILVWQKMI